MTQSPTAIRELLNRYDLTPRKAYGQHFLADQNLIRKVADLAEVRPDSQIVEVGPGTGALTRELAARGASVVAIEIDERFGPLLGEVLEGSDVDLRFADAMSVDWAETLGPGEWQLVANLPYNVGTPLVLDLLIEFPRLTRFVVMVQREVAERLAAAPGAPDYGLPSVVVGLTASVGEKFRVSPAVFVPPPRVDSMVIRLDRRSEVDDRLGAALVVARTAFAHRRQMLRRTLAGMIDESSMRQVGVAPTARPEELHPEQFLALGEMIDHG